MSEFCCYDFLEDGWKSQRRSQRWTSPDKAKLCNLDGNGKGNGNQGPIITEKSHAVGGGKLGIQELRKKFM